MHTSKIVMTETLASTEGQIWDQSRILKDHQCLLKIVRTQFPVCHQIRSKADSLIQTSFEILITEKVQIVIVEANSDHRAMLHQVKYFQILLEAPANSK